MIEDYKPTLTKLYKQPKLNVQKLLKGYTIDEYKKKVIPYNAYKSAIPIEEGVIDITPKNKNISIVSKPKQIPMKKQQLIENKKKIAEQTKAYNKVLNAKAKKTNFGKTPDIETIQKKAEQQYQTNIKPKFYEELVNILDNTPVQQLVKIYFNINKIKPPNAEQIIRDTILNDYLKGDISLVKIRNQLKKI